MRERRLLAQLRALHPDLAVVTGDVVNGYLGGLDHEAKTARIERIVALLAQVNDACQCPVFLVRGNHDDDDQLTERLPDSGMRLLINDRATATPAAAARWRWSASTTTRWPMPRRLQTPRHSASPTSTGRARW
ncbi:MAG: metallophosphoesterase [Planctomycetota bacterium]